MFEDLKAVYKKGFKNTIGTIKKVPLSIFLVLFYFILLGIFESLTSFFGNGMLVGLLIPVGYSLILSSYFEMLSDVITFGRIILRSFKNSFMRQFESIYSVFFFLFIINYVLRISFTNSDFILVINIFLSILFSSISESIYLEGYTGISCFKDSVNFIKENYLQWLIPFITIKFLIGYFFYGQFDLIFRENPMFSHFVSPLNVAYFLVNDFTKGLKLILFLIILGFFAIFRGHLYKILHGSSIRKRKFEGLL